jgi:hypothetical protein
MKWLVSFLPFLMLFASVVPCAPAQSVTLTTSDDPVGDAVETTEDTLRDLPQPGSLGDSTDRLGDTAGDGLDSGTALAGASPGKAFRTRFDRLPPRLERLLERIELGRNVRANLRRLERALASASVRDRARLLRLLNAEIRRLRADGVSPAERRSIERLIRTRATISALSVPTPTSAADATMGTSGSALAPGTGPRVGTGVLRAFVAGSKASPREGATRPRDGAGSPSGPSGTPDGGAFPLIQVLLALCVALLVIGGGLAIKEDRAA